MSILKHLAKAATAVVDVPVSLAADTLTMGGALTDKEEPYTAAALKRLANNVKNAADPDK